MHVILAYVKLEFTKYSKINVVNRYVYNSWVSTRPINNFCLGFFLYFSVTKKALVVDEINVDEIMFAGTW